MQEHILMAASWIKDYLEIPNYLSVRVTGIRQGEKIYKSEEEYWRDTLGPMFYKNNLKNPRLRFGDVVVLKNFQLSPWHPSYPGLFWTHDGQYLQEIMNRNLKHSDNLGFHFHPHMKNCLVRQGGFATLRTRVRNRLSMYGATTSGNMNAAIPVLISSNVKGNLIRFSKKTPLMEVDLRGVITPIPYTYFPHYYRRHIPRLCLLVNSILNVKKYISDFSLTGSAWTVYHNPEGKHEDKYGYTYANFNPIDESSIVESTSWIENYISDYTKGKGIAITDYDEVTPRFDTAVVPLEQVMQGNVDFDTLNSLFRGVDLRQQQWRDR